MSVDFLAPPSMAGRVATVSHSANGRVITLHKGDKARVLRRLQPLGFAAYKRKKLAIIKDKGNGARAKKL